MSKLSNLPPGVTDRMIEEQAGALQPFDPGYDYEADKAIEERLAGLTLSDVYKNNYEEALALHGLIGDAAREIRALRLRIKTLEWRLDSADHTIRELTEPYGDEDA